MIGRRLSHFYIIRTLGSGGMGVVYEAQDTRLPRSVALKVLKPSLTKDLAAIRRFRREARLASSLNHPNICTVLDVDDGDDADGQAFIAMELLHGQSLKTRLNAAPLLLTDIVDIAEQIADALVAAHDHDIMHRDLTPANVFLTDDGLVKLLDFGLARHFGDAMTERASDDLTAEGAVAGTIHYMAPERFADGMAVDHRSDLYSLGAVLYQMATGVKPFDAVLRNDLISLIREQEPLPILNLSPQHPSRLSEIVERLLAKSPGDRYQTAAAFRDDLKPLNALKSLAARQAVETTGTRRGHDIGVAPLPFELIGAENPDHVAFRDGLVEDLRTKLTAVPGVRMAPRTSTRAAAGTTARELGERLGVALIVEGTIQFAGDRLRVNAGIVEAATERAIQPALTLDHEIGDLFGAQAEIADGIVKSVAPAIAQMPGRRQTQEPEAYLAFKRGQAAWSTCLAGGWRTAVDLYQQAIERDPGFAVAHLALANAYNFLGLYSLMQPKRAFDVAGRFALRALELDPTLAAAHTEVAMAKFGGAWDWDAAEREFRRAMALDPKDALSHAFYAWLLMLLGREEAAVSEAHAACALAPSSRLVRGALGQTLYLAQRYEEAIEVCNQCLAEDPEYILAIHLRGLCGLNYSRSTQAIADLEHAAQLASRAPFYLGLLGLCYGEFGMRDRALALVTELDQRAHDSYVPPQCYVFIYAGLGDRKKALAYQEKAYEDGASPFNYLTPTVRQLYALDPYHQQRLEQMRLIL